MKALLSILLSLMPFISSAQENSPEVGKHVAGNMDAATMILSLLMVLVLILLLAFVLKRFQPSNKSLSGLKVITSLHLTTRERLVVVQVGEKQLLLGVTANQITLLDTLEEPLEENATIPTQLGQSFISMLKK